MAKSMTKSQVASELAEKTGQSIRTAQAMLDGLAEIAYREAVNGFVIPGICKLSVTTRKARRFRHPVSGQLFMIAARDSLAITALKKCRNSAVQVQDAILIPVDESPDGTLLPASSSAADQRQTAAPPPMQDAPPEEDGGIVFVCEHCGNTVSAPVETSGLAGECPFCSGEIVIPASSPTLQRPSEDLVPAKPLASTGIMGFVTFVCHACNQEIEAPVNMVGIQAACPSCGSSVYVPAKDEVPEPCALAQDVQDDAPKPDLRSMTIRIDLSDIL